jgi:AbrB family looped-hinge helix DNA binding protein
VGDDKMNVTSKGQVTIPRKIREKYNITPFSEVDFVEENGRVYLVKLKKAKTHRSKFSHLRGIATVKLSTEEIMALTRGEE